MRHIGIYLVLRRNWRLRYRRTKESL